MWISTLDTLQLARRLVMGQHLLDLGNCPGRVQMLWTGLGTVHDGVTLEHGVRVVHLLQTFGLLKLIL